MKIFDLWPSQFKQKFGGNLPSDYICFDTEYTSSSVERGYIFQIGHVIVQDNKIVDRAHCSIDWYKSSPIIGRSVDQSLARIKSQLGCEWHITPETLSGGLNPIQAFKFYHELFETCKSNGLAFVAQNGQTADERMLNANFSKFIGKSFVLPANNYFDVGAIYKANFVCDSLDPCVNMYEQAVLPLAGDSLKAYFHRITSMRIAKVYWSLSTILEKCAIAHEGKHHNAETDAANVASVMEFFKQEISKNGKTD